jgi:hypothetical protein
LLSFPLGASKILSTMFCIIDTEATIELDENLHELLNNYLDLNASIYIALITVSIAKIIKSVKMQFWNK